ncbi:unnamed protein product [Callosobruchus maculatus]|uniref:Uncharacterized protein n=1 Tax=Callosobruchus maculatus TaxID=64391 RepID=A0A653BIH2_CALMS|nr:unnamed protein product [Callosobruchus maculatus]
MYNPLAANPPTLHYKATNGQPHVHYLNYEANTTILLNPKSDWMRAQKRHFGDLPTYSAVTFSEPKPPRRELRLYCNTRNQRRHYCNVNTRSYLDNYF